MGSSPTASSPEAFTIIGLRARTGVGLIAHLERAEVSVERRRGGIPERSKGPDCKSGGTAFAGSNPASPIWYCVRQSQRISVCDDGGRDRGRGRSSMVELQPSKLVVWVRFPSPALASLGWRLRELCVGRGCRAVSALLGVAVRSA